LPKPKRLQLLKLGFDAIDAIDWLNKTVLSRIQKLKKEVALLRKLVYKDPLTGLYNRRGFLEEGEKIFQTTLQAKKFEGRRRNFLIKDLSLVFVDLDDFKKINDVFGHQAGDAVLKNCSQILENSLRSSDLICRWGGEEMVILLVGAAFDDAMKIAEDLRKKIEGARFKFRGRKIKLSASFGVVETKAGNLENLVFKADKAMYQAKKEGKNKVVTI